MSSAARRIAVTLVVACATVVAAACGSGSTGSAGSSHSTSSTTAAQQTFVVIGDRASAPADDSIPIDDSWPQWFFRTALPRTSVFVNLSSEPASARSVLRSELPIAQQLHPTVVGVLIGLDDAADQSAPPDFEQSITALINGLRAAGTRTILVATLPAEASGVAPYNQAITDAVQRDGAVLVDLAPLHLTFVNESTDFTPVPDRASQRAIASAFTAAYRAAIKA